MLVSVGSHNEIRENNAGNRMAATASHKPTTSEPDQGELWGLRIALGPVLVMVVAQLLFEYQGFRLPQLTDALAGRFSDPDALGLEQVLAETRARLFWASTVLLFYFAALALAFTGFQLLRRCLSGRGLRWFLATGGALVVASVAYLGYSSWRGNPVSAIYTFTAGCLEASGRFAPSELLVVKAAVTILNALAVAAPIVGLIGGLSLLAPRRSQGEAMLDHLARQMRRLKLVVNLGSAMMVVGILHMLVWMRWPAVLVDDPGLAQEIQGLATTVAVYWGATYTLLIFTFYVPTYLVLNRRAEPVLAETFEGLGTKESRVWLKEHGFMLSPAGQLPQAAAILAPLLAGPVASFFTNLPGALG